MCITFININCVYYISHILCIFVGEVTYVARTFYHNDGVCGAYIPSLKVASVPHAGRERQFELCDILVCRDPGILFWMNAGGGHVPDLAVGVGNMYREEIYVARSRPGTKLNSIETVNGQIMNIDKNFQGPMLGKLHPSHQTMYLAHNRLEYFVHEYQVLCAYRPPSSIHTHAWIPVSSDVHLPEGIVAGGLTDKGETTYVARVAWENDNGNYVAGYVVPSEHVCRYAVDGIARSSSDYEVLVSLYPNSLQWQASDGFNSKKGSIALDEDDMNVHAYGFSVKLAFGRTNSNAQLLPYPHHGSIQLYLQPEDGVKVIGGARFSGHGNTLSVAYNDQPYSTDQFEVLIPPNAPHTLLELSRHAVLRYTNAVHDRIDKLPLPERMKSFCQLRQEEIN